MKLTPIEDTLIKIFKARHREYEEIAGGKIEPKEVIPMLMAEGFAKEPVVRYTERIEEERIMLNMLQTGTIRGKRLKSAPRPFGIPAKATGGKW